MKNKRILVKQSITSNANLVDNLGFGYGLDFVIIDGQFYVLTTKTENKPFLTNERKLTDNDYLKVVSKRKINVLKEAIKSYLNTDKDSFKITINEFVGKLEDLITTKNNLVTITKLVKTITATKRSKVRKEGNLYSVNIQII